MKANIMHKKSACKILYRYTDLSSVIYLLKKGSLTFLDPDFWADKNDAFFMAHYAKSTGLCVRALCFTMQPETFHHWKVFAAGIDGVRIDFDQKVLIDSIKEQTGVRYGKVKYRTVNSICTKKPKIREVPFLKRIPFKPEQEFRFLHESSLNTPQAVSIPFAMAAIRRVTLSPLLDIDLLDPLADSLRQISGLSGLTVCRSTLLENERWKGALIVKD